MATMGWLRRRPPVEPRNRALPRVKTPPSDPTIQAPGGARGPVPGAEVVPTAAGSAAIEAVIPSALATTVVAATTPTRRRRPRRGRPMVRILLPNSPSDGSVPAGLGNRPRFVRIAPRFVT